MGNHSATPHSNTLMLKKSAQNKTTIGVIREVSFCAETFGTRLSGLRLNISTSDSNGSARAKIQGRPRLTAQPIAAGKVQTPRLAHIYPSPTAKDLEFSSNVAICDCTRACKTP